MKNLKNNLQVNGNEFSKKTGIKLFKLSNKFNNEIENMNKMLNVLKENGKYYDNNNGKFINILDDNITFIMFNNKYICPIYKDVKTVVAPLCIHSNGIVERPMIHPNIFIEYDNINMYKKKSIAIVEEIDILTFNPYEYYGIK